MLATDYLCHKLPQTCFVCRNHNPILSSFNTYHREYNKSNTTGATCGARNCLHFRSSWVRPPPRFFTCLIGVRVHSCCQIHVYVFSSMLWFPKYLCLPPSLSEARVGWSLVLCVMLSFSFWQLYCMSFIDLWLLITSLISSDYPYTGSNSLIMQQVIIFTKFYQIYWRFKY